MIIQRLDLKAFGRFTDLSLDFAAGPRRFHLVYGPNESGKTTSLRAITGLLFGIDHRSGDNYVHNNNQLRIGGLLVADDGTSLECVRRKGRKATLRDADDDQPIDEAILTKMLGGIDQETFSTRFGLSHEELVKGGAAILAGEGDLGEILFAAGAGVSHLREIQSQIGELHDSLFLARGNRLINQAIKDLEQKRKELRQAQILPTTFMELRDRLQLKRDEANQLERELQQATIEFARLRAFEQALPLLPQWRSDQTELASLFDVPRLDDAFSERRREAESERELAAKLYTTQSERMAEWSEQLQSLPLDTAIIDHESEVEAVFQELAARDKADRDRVELLRVRKNLDRKVVDLLSELSVNVLAGDGLESADAVDDAVGRLRVSDSLRTRIHELAGQYERLMQQRDDANDRLNTLRRKFADVNDQLQDISAPQDPASLAAVIDEIGSPASLLESAVEQREICQRSRRRAEDLRRQLDGCDGDYRRVARLQIPAAAMIDRLVGEVQQADKSVAELKTQLSTLQQQRDRLHGRLLEQEQGDSLPTPQMLQAARLRRDRTIEQMREQPGDVSAETLAALGQQVAEADRIVDSIGLHHERIHQRSLDQHNLQATDQQIAECDSQLEAALGHFTAVTERWDALWLSCGVQADSPERMKRWLADHQQLVDCVAQLEIDDNRHEQLQQRIARATTRLRSALNSLASSKAVPVGAGYTQAGLFDPPPEDSLDSLYDEAVALRAESQRQRQEFDALRRKRDELAEELPAAQTRADTCQRAVDQWQTDWRRVTDSFVDPLQSTPSVVVSMLSRIDDLCAKKRERDILTSRIQSIGEDDDKYERRIQRLAAALGVDNDAETGATVRMMFARLQTERSAVGKRASIKAEIERANQRLREAAAQQERSKIILSQLCVEAGIESADRLPECERRSRERGRVEASLRDLENQISLLAGDEPIEQFVQAAREQQPSLLADQIQHKQQQVADTRGQLSELQQEIGGIKHELDLMNGSNRAAELHQSIQFLVGTIDRNAEEYARLKIASMIIRRATEHYRRENQNPVLAEAEKMFARLTCGEYRALKVDYDAKGNSILFGERAESTESDSVDVPVPAMSVGTADALYLALRLASLKHQLRHGHPIPLVIDDCLIQLDDQRAVAALQILSELSATTQVILFTHHRHLLDLANDRLNSGEFHVHQL
jgi:uncharacterized protein YhaN